MLAQSFRSAADLGITEPQLSALQKTLVLLETGKIKHYDPDRGLKITNDWFEAGIEPRFDGYFNLGTWADKRECGTVCCLGGTAEAISGVSFQGWMNKHTSNLHDLFAPHDIDSGEWSVITPSQAATALRSYLTTGDARWDLAVGESRTAAQHGGT